MNPETESTADFEQAEDSAVDKGHFLTVEVGGELFAIAISKIREVIHCPRITPLPLSPKAVPAVINLRGEVVGVVDLSVRLGRAPTRIERRTCIVVVEVQMEDALSPLGLLVDAVEEAVETTSDMMETPPAFGSGFRSDFQSAILRRGSQFVSVLDIDTVAAAEELESLVASHAQAAVARLARLVA